MVKPRSAEQQIPNEGLQITAAKYNHKVQSHLIRPSISIQVFDEVIKCRSLSIIYVSKRAALNDRSTALTFSRPILM
jgi:hypothetical protein